MFADDLLEFLSSLPTLFALAFILAFLIALFVWFKRLENRCRAALAAGDRARAEGRYADAKRHFREAFRLSHGRGWGMPDVMATALTKLADVCQTVGRHAEAEQMARRAWQLTETRFGPDHPEVTISLNNLAMTLAGQQRHAEALPIAERAVRVAREADAPPANFAEILDNLAQLYRALNRPGDAEPLEREAQRLCPRQRGQDGAVTAGPSPAGPSAPP